MRIVRHDDAALRCAIVFAAPDPQLRPYVREYVGGHEDSAAPIRRREVPSGIVPVVFTFSGGIRELERASSEKWTERSTFAAGLHDTFTLVESTGPTDGLQVNLTALGARLFLQRPLHELTNRTVDLEDLLGAGAGRLTSELYDAPTWAARFELLDRFIQSRIMAASPPVAAHRGL